VFAALEHCSEGCVSRGRQHAELATLADGSLDPALAGTTWRKRPQCAGGDTAAAAAAGTLVDAQQRREITLARLRQRELAAKSAEYVPRTTFNTVR
jgi:hypothetical protein